MVDKRQKSISNWHGQPLPALSTSCCSCQLCGPVRVCPTQQWSASLAAAPAANTYKDDNNDYCTTLCQFYNNKPFKGVTYVNSTRNDDVSASAQQ